jgi:hypothetical protein
MRRGPDPTGGLAEVNNNYDRQPFLEFENLPLKSYDFQTKVMLNVTALLDFVDFAISSVPTLKQELLVRNKLLHMSAWRGLEMSRKFRRKILAIRRKQNLFSKERDKTN